jgi:hypothetical protein
MTYRSPAELVSARSPPRIPAVLRSVRTWWFFFLRLAKKVHPSHSLTSSLSPKRGPACKFVGQEPAWVRLLERTIRWLYPSAFTYLHYIICYLLNWLNHSSEINIISKRNEKKLKDLPINCLTQSTQPELNYFAYTINPPCCCVEVKFPVLDSAPRAWIRCNGGAARA